MAEDDRAKPASKIRVRMYRQGLGDCFLLRFPRKSGKAFHIVIDSGVLKGTSNAAARMREVAEDIEQETEGRIDVLVVTHEHWDHLSAFTEAREVWSRMRIAELWLAWTEDPEDALAARLRAEREARAEEIHLRIQAIRESSGVRLDATRYDRIDALLGFLGMDLGAAAAGGTRASLEFISGRAERIVHLRPATSLTRAGMAGVRVFVLGPPHDEAQLKRSDPSKARPEVYSDPAHGMAFQGTSVEGDDGDPDQPFGADVGDAVDTPEAYDAYLKAHFPTLVGERPDAEWRRLAHEDFTDLERLALALDGDTNNTSLALAFELADGRVLLFPADAQVGNWLSWHDHTWRVGSRRIRADDLLARTVLYKVGHHGSHNATLKDEGLEKMTHRGLIALIPVNEDMARRKRWKMPFGPLQRRLQEKTLGRVILADSEAPLPTGEQLAALTATERRRFEQAIQATDLFIDISL